MSRNSKGPQRRRVRRTSEIRCSQSVRRHQAEAGVTISCPRQDALFDAPQRAIKLLLAGVAESLTVIDLRDLKEDQSLHLLRVSLPVGDRSLTLYEEVHPQRSIVNRQLHHQFLRRQAAIMPARAAPIVVADSGCTDPNQGAALR